MQIKNEQGVWIQDHEGKAGLPWASFRHHMGTTSSPSMLFDLANLIEPINELEALIAPV